MLVPQKRPFPVRKRETRDGRREENTLSQTSLSTASQKRAHLWRRMVARKYCYLMLIPVAAYFIIFCYVPMYGLLISFQDYKVFKGIWGSEWVGLQNFRDFVNGRQFWPVIGNTLILNLESLCFTFTMPIIFALLLNELRSARFCKTIQTITYMPHFISTVVVVSMMQMLLSPTNGIINQLIMKAGNKPIYFMNKAEFFRPLSIASGVWQDTGWSSIIYLAAIAGIDPVYYEAATIDGATWWQKIVKITLPCIRTTILIMLILRMGQMMNSNFEKVMLMQTSGNKSVSQLLSTYVYERGVLNSDFGYATAVSLFNSLVSLLLVGLANFTSRKLAGESLW